MLHEIVSAPLQSCVRGKITKALTMTAYPFLFSGKKNSTYFKMIFDFKFDIRG